jgi:hypothetical protein
VKNSVAPKLLKMERETGLEPATSSLGSWHSTTELLPHSAVGTKSSLHPSALPRTVRLPLPLS